MLTLKKIDEQQIYELTATKSKADLEQLEDEQLGIFADIIIAILLNQNLNDTENET